MELEDIQGLLVRGHGDMASAAYIMLHITEAENARNWLRDMLAEITPGEQKTREPAATIGLYPFGDAKIGLR